MYSASNSSCAAKGNFIYNAVDGSEDIDGACPVSDIVCR